MVQQSVVDYMENFDIFVRMLELQEEASKIAERPNCFSLLCCLPPRYNFCTIKDECLEAAKKKWEQYKVIYQ